MSKREIEEIWEELGHRTCDLQDEIAMCDIRVDRINQVMQGNYQIVSAGVMELYELLNALFQRVYYLEQLETGKAA